MQLVCWHYSNPKISLFSETKGKKFNSKEQIGIYKRYARYAFVSKKRDSAIWDYEKAMTKIIQLQNMNIYEYITKDSKERGRYVRTKYTVSSFGLFIFNKWESIRLRFHNHIKLYINAQFTEWNNLNCQPDFCLKFLKSYELWLCLRERKYSGYLKTRNNRTRQECSSTDY